MSGNDKRKIPGGIGSAALVNLSGLIIGTLEDFVNCPTVLCVMARSNHAPLAPTCRQGGAPFPELKQSPAAGLRSRRRHIVIRTSSAPMEIWPGDSALRTSPSPTNDETTDEHGAAQPQPKKISPRTREDASWEPTHLACSVNREAVSTLEACAPRDGLRVLGSLR